MGAFNITMVELISYYVFGLKLALLSTAFLILLSSVDDAFIDFCFWGRLIYEKTLGRRRYPVPTLERISSIEERPIAIMIPAWQESAVIAQMIEVTKQTFEYRKYDLFIGCYQNDPATIKEVQRMCGCYENVHLAPVPHDGPTCKADCLNWIIQSINLVEQDTGVEFSVVVMHDAEDVVHPMELRLLNYVLQWEDMVQLPVFSLERHWRAFTACHYLDEFAEYHTKDLPVRQVLTGIVPSAGVATAFNRYALKALSEANQNILFNTNSLTEDYDISFRLAEIGLSGNFIRFEQRLLGSRRSPFTGQIRPATVCDVVATREYFPHSMKAAVRQKARWMLGISFQGWREFGWRGGLGMRYMLYRDRKGIVTSILAMLGYFIALNVVVFQLIYWLNSNSYRYPALVERNSALWFMLQINLGFLCNRLWHRAVFVGWLYGWEQAVLSAPRMVWGNFINFFACLRASRLFILHSLTGKSLAWDKTDHVFPSLDEVRVAVASRSGASALEQTDETDGCSQRALKSNGLVQRVTAFR